MRKTTQVAMVLSVVGTLASMASAFAFAGQQYAKDAKITMAEARRIAVNAHPGTITDQELEREKGGSGLRYSFDIKGVDATYEVGVDAKTGSVLENSIEGKHPD